MSSAHKILVVGGGAGGLELVTALGRKLRGKPVELKLLNGRPTHIWKPLLHEVATGGFNSGENELNYWPHSYENNYKFALGWMAGLDRKDKKVKVNALKLGGKLLCPPRTLDYDTLVLAVGSVSDTFGTPGAREHCMFLDSPHDADAIRLSMLLKGLAVLYKSGPSPKLRIGIVGGGATGVELASEISRTVRALHITGFEADQLEITLMDSGPRILAMADAELSKFAQEELERKHIKVKLNCAIKGVTATGFEFKDGSKLEAEIRIWTAGVSGPAWLSAVDLKTDARNRVLVDGYLKTEEDPSIYAIGDCAATPWEGGTLPATAQVAHQQAMWLAGHLARGGTSSSPFGYTPHGYLVSLGKATAVGSLRVGFGKKGYEIKGIVAKGLYTTMYRKHQAAVYGIPKMLSLLIGDRFRHIATPEHKFH